MFRRLLLVFPLLFLLVSCGARYHLKRNQISFEEKWPFAHGTAAATGAVESGEFRGHLNIVWQTRYGGKPAGPLTIGHGCLIYPNTKKRIVFYDLITGQKLGRIKLKGVPQSGLVTADSLGFVALGPRRSRLYAYDLIRYKVLWNRPVKDAQPSPIIVNNRLLVSSTEGKLEAYALEDGQVDWAFEPEQQLAAAVSYADGRLYQPVDRGRLCVLSVEDARELYQVDFDGPVVSPVAAGERIFVADMLGRVYALEPASGAILWQQDIGAPIWTTPVVAHGRVFIGHSGGGVVALETAGGRQLWRYSTGEVVKGSPLAVGEFVIVGTMTGRVLVLKADDGTLVDAAELEGAIAFGPVTDGRRVYVATQSGEIVCFGEKNEAIYNVD